MARLRLFDIRMSSLPQTLGLCDGDIPQIAEYVNQAQRRLIFAKESGDEGWHGTFAEVIFTQVSRINPYITCPRHIARVEVMDVCRHPVVVNNQFVEYLEFGNGRMPKWFRRAHGCQVQVYSRNNAITFADLSSPPQMLRFYSTNAADYGAGLHVIPQGLDQNSMTIYSQLGTTQTSGECSTLDAPFTQTTSQFTQITGIQKDVTQGQIQIFQVDPTTGDQTLISTMEPGETVAGYRRYYLNNLPNDCCHASCTTPQTIQVHAIVKLEPIPVVVDTDYLVLTNIEAVMNECEAIRYERMDNKDSHQMADRKHNRAIRLLIGEATHYYGQNDPAVSFHPFGSARLEKQKIGSLM